MALFRYGSSQRVWRTCKVRLEMKNFENFERIRRNVSNLEGFTTNDWCVVTYAIRHKKPVKKEIYSKRKPAVCVLNRFFLSRWKRTVSYILLSLCAFVNI